MGDQDDGAFFSNPGKVSVYIGLRLCVECGGRLIENQDFCRAHICTGYCKLLPLADGEFAATLIGLAERGFQPMRQGFNHLISTALRRRVFNRACFRLHPTAGYILPRCEFIPVVILKHDTRAPEPFDGRDFPEIHPIYQNSPVGRNE